MVFLHFPSNLTDEEHMLHAKYSKLRKKVKKTAHYIILFVICIKC